MYKKGDSISIGTYPQTEIMDQTIIRQIDALADPGTAVADVEIGGKWYRRISVKYSNVVEEADFGSENYRYYVYEPICWTILSVDGCRALLSADKGLDCQWYHLQWKAVDWADSTLRKWLNEDFLNTAFSKEEQEAVLQTMVSNTSNPKYGTQDGDVTTDQVFLLSIDEVQNPEFGFNEEMRRRMCTDYAAGMGVSRFDGLCSPWWLRTKGFGRKAASVYGDGGINEAGFDVAVIPGSIGAAAIVPALWLDLGKAGSQLT
jgi:hypothetical protein